jgi:membrane-associated protease RseP (regulator of RpoE activity)
VAESGLNPFFAEPLKMPGEKPETARRERNKLGQGITLLVLMILNTVILLSLLFGKPAFGSSLITSIIVIALVAVNLLLIALSARPSKAASDIHMLTGEQLSPAVLDVMDVRLAIEEAGIQTYTGNLQYPSDDSYSRLSSNLEQTGALALMQPDEKLEATITIVPKSMRPDARTKPINPVVHIMLFVLTLATTTYTGALHQGINLLQQPQNFWVGLPYSLSLLAIIGLHEAGHYFVARRYRVNATPPYFLPAPFPLGTFGAFISMRSPPVNRKAMFDTSVTGPLVGLLLSLCFLFVGLKGATVGETIFHGSLLAPQVGSSVLFTLIAQLANPSLAFGADLHLNAFAFSGWLGLLITAINLIPIGQLDGGHVLQAMLGPKLGALVSGLAMMGLFLLAFFVWPSLLLFAFLVFFLASSSGNSLDGITPIGIGRNALGAFAMISLLAILLPMPETVYQSLF